MPKAGKSFSDFQKLSEKFNDGLKTFSGVRRNLACSKEPNHMKTSQLLTLLSLTAASSVATAAQHTFTVTNTNPTGLGSLSMAITDPNGIPNIDADTPDVIVFAIPTSDAIATRRPAFSRSRPHSGCRSPPIQSSSMATQERRQAEHARDRRRRRSSHRAERRQRHERILRAGFSRRKQGSTVRGLIINRFTTGLSTEAGGIKVLGNFLGTDSAGLSALGNGSGIVASSDGGHQIGSPCRPTATSSPATATDSS